MKSKARSREDGGEKKNKIIVKKDDEILNYSRAKEKEEKEKGQHHALHSILRFEKRSCVQSPLPTCLISWTSEVGWTSLKPNHKDSKIWRKIKNFNEKINK